MDDRTLVDDRTLDRLLATLHGLDAGGLLRRPCSASWSGGSSWTTEA